MTSVQQFRFLWQSKLVSNKWCILWETGFTLSLSKETEEHKHNRRQKAINLLAFNVHWSLKSVSQSQNWARLKYKSLQHPSRQKLSIQTCLEENPLTSSVCHTTCFTSSSFNSDTDISISAFLCVILRLSSSLRFSFPFHLLHHIFASLSISFLGSFHLQRLILSILIFLQLLLSAPSALVVCVNNASCVSFERCRYYCFLCVCECVRSCVWFPNIWRKHYFDGVLIHVLLKLLLFSEGCQPGLPPFKISQSGFFL